MAIASFNASIRAFASILNPLQTRLDIVLTDFHPNKNNQCIALSEAENIINSAKNQPIKINFTDGKESGHNNSYPIGTLTDVYLDGDVIRAKSVLWKTEFPEEDQYLRKATAEGKTLQTSWEVYYKESETVDEVEFLRDCQFAATVIVSNPAYDGRTPILSIAELAAIEEKEKREKAELDELEKLRNDLMSFYDWITVLYEKTYEIEEAERNSDKDPGKMVERMSKVSDRIMEWSNRLETAKSEIESLTTKVTELETSKAELETQIEAEKKSRAEQERVNKVKVYLEEPDTAFIVSLSEEGFTSYLSSLEKASSKKAKSERNEPGFIPEPYGSDRITIQDIAKAIKEDTKR